MFTEATNRSDNSSPPLAGGDKGRGLAPAGAHESASARVAYRRSDRRQGLFARCRAQTPPLIPSRKGRGRFLSRSSSLLWIMIAALALSLAACGKKGPPEPPEGKTDQFPRQYPDPSSL